MYANHLEQVREQITRRPHPFPTLRLRKAASIDEYTMDDIDASQGYEHHPALSGQVAV